MKIVLDFDDTIFNTCQMMQEFLAVFNNLGFQEKQFWDAYAECKKRVGDFDKEIMISSLLALKSFNKKKVEIEINSIISKLKNYVYSDFFNFVSEFDKKDLILLSFGNPVSQEKKIENSEVASFFDEVIITSKEKVEDLKLICEKYNNDKIFFIDDKAEQIDKVKEKLPQIITMKMERSNLEHLSVKSKLADYVVKDLNEAKNIINNLEK